MLRSPSPKALRLVGLVLAACIGLTVAGCGRAAEDPAFGAKVRAYLLAHPEVIEEAVAKLQDQKQAAADAKVKLAVDKNRGAIERDPRDFVANPAGKITVTEFYDYRCPHCINAAPTVLGLIHDNPDVRFVFKEMPIFGSTSDHAARTAIALKASGGDYLGLYRQLMAARGLDDAAVDRIAQGLGLDPAKAAAPAVQLAADAQIADIRKLANTLDIDGTPTFIIGDTVVPGEDMDAVKAAIFSARNGQKTG